MPKRSLFIPSQVTLVVFIKSRMKLSLRVSRQVTARAREINTRLS